MKSENRTFLDENRHHYNILVNAGYVKHLDMATRQGIVNVIRDEFNPGYLCCMHCSEDIIKMLQFAYIQYDKWIAENPVAVEFFRDEEGLHIVSEKKLDGTIRKETFPKHDKPDIAKVVSKKKKRGKK